MAFTKKTTKAIEENIFNDDNKFINQIKNCNSVEELENFLSSNVGSVSTEVVQIFFNFINP
jgi:hypothetical protein